MDVSPRGVVAFTRTTGGRRLIKYSAVSVVSVVVSEVALLIALHFFTATWSNIIAVAVGTIPSYELNRSWVWGKSGKSHLWKEVVPFWALSFLGLVLSTIAVKLVSDHVIHDATPDTTFQKLVILATNLAAFGVLWVGKFLIINKLLFHHHPEAVGDELSTV
jgi:putative flippase GtrA